jgi:serpin B
MFLAAAIYFHGAWTQQFDSRWTRDTLFTTRTGRTVPVRLMHVETSAVDLPKFRLTWSDWLNTPLTTLGMGIAFSDAADFSNIASGQRLKISTVQQKTFVDVDEQGTTAAAVTGVGIIPTFVHVPLSVRADHPFVYVLRERLSGTILFVGAFAHPPAA